MKLSKMLCSMLWLFLWLPLLGKADTAGAPLQMGTLTVHITGIRNDNGSIRIALFNSAQVYEMKNSRPEDAYSRAVLSIKNGEALWQIKSLPYGAYGIKLFHDEDNSGQLKKSFVGRPTEGIGFSNNPVMNNHAPTFDEVKFDVNQPQTDTIIKMINPK